MNEKTTRPLVNEKSPTEFQDTSMNSRTKWLHVYFAFVAAYGSLGFGLSVVFSSPFLEQMFQVSNFTLWTDGFQQCIYQNLVGPLMPFGAVIGGFLSSICVGVLGLVTPMLAGAVVFVAGWSMIGVSWFVSSPIVFRDLILAGRFLTGLATGLVASTIPVYVAEISLTESMRGKLGSLFVIGIGIGTFACFVLGNYIPYWQVAFIACGLFVVQFPLLFTISESPSRSQNLVKNLNSLWSSRSGYNTKHAFDQLIGSGFLWQAIVISALFSFQQFTGLNAIAFYAGPIFLSAGGRNWPISPGLAASITLGIIQIIAAAVVAPLMHKIDRTLLFFIGALGMMLANVGMASYFAIVNGVLPLPSPQNATNRSSACFFDISNDGSGLGEQYSPLAITSIGIFIISFSGGWGPPLYLYAAELFPNASRGVGMGIAICTNWISTTIITLLFPVSNQHIGSTLSFLVLAGISGLAAIFVPLFTPETRGKPMGFSSSQQFSVIRNVKDFGKNVKMFLSCRHCLSHSTSDKEQIISANSGTYE
jgi:MFS family permease